MSLKSMRKASGLTQKGAADLFGIKYRTYQNYENGITSPDMDTAAKFARHFGCTIGDLFDLKEGSSISLDENEQSLIDLYRSMDDDERRTLMRVARALSFASKTELDESVFRPVNSVFSLTTRYKKGDES